MNKIIDYLMKNKIAQVIGAVVLVVAMAVLVVAGIGFFSSLLMILMIAIVAYFGSVRELAGSVVTVILAKTFLPEIREVLGIWTSSPKVVAMCDFVEKTGYIKLILVIFFFAFLLRFITGSVKLFNVNVNNKNTTDKVSENEKKKER